MTKRGTVWSYDRRLTTSSLAYYRYEIPWKDRFAEKYHRFLLSDLNWTFINTKRSTYLNLPYPRTLYMYSSLCAPVRMGDQTTDLIRQIHYQPILEGNYYYEPKQIHYIKLRKNHIDVVETQISESENNNSAQFTDGASIVTLHSRLMDAATQEKDRGGKFPFHPLTCKSASRHEWQDNIEKELQDMIRRVDQRTAFLRKWIDNITDGMKRL